jgi:hypothetical protein
MFYKINIISNCKISLNNNFALKYKHSRMKRLSIISPLILCLYLLTACSCQHKKNNKIDRPKIEKKVEVKINRYDKDLFSINKKDLKSELVRLKKTYSFFLDGDLNDPANIKQLSDYLNDPQMIQNYREVQKQFPDLTGLEKELSDELSYFAYYFPDHRLPQVYTYVCGMDFESPVIYADSVLIIALDMYLGKNYSLYTNFGLPAFIRYSMAKEYILRDCAEAIANYYCYQELKDATCLDHMVYNGKLQLFVDALLPETADTIKIEYTKKQLEWCQDNEFKLWTFFIENKMLYSKDYNAFMKFYSKGPFTTAFGKESPPRTAIWVGWQILRAYTRNTGHINLKKLTEIKDAQQILQISKYKPKKP